MAEVILGALFGGVCGAIGGWLTRRLLLAHIDGEADG